MWLLLTLLACTSEAPAPEPAPEPTKPRGRIGGEPILPDPVVVGAISAEDVDAGIDAQKGAIAACWTEHGAKQTGLRGRVLYKFTIAKEGRVDKAVVKSSSLRHPETEACVTDVIAKATFTPLKTGKLAIVHYPFAFP